MKKPEARPFDGYHRVGGRRPVSHALGKAIDLAVEIAREGRGTGALFLPGDADAVLARSRCAILDPLHGHPDRLKSIADPAFRRTLKELAHLRGAFVISDGGIVISAARFVDTAPEAQEALAGLSRAPHPAAAYVSGYTGAVAVVVSGDSVVRVLDGGELVSEVLPQQWRQARQHRGKECPC